MTTPRLLSRVSALTLLTLLPPVLGAQTNAPAADAEIAELRAQLAALSQRLATLEQQQSEDRADADPVAQKVADMPEVSLGKKGLQVTSPDGDYRFRLDGVFQADARFFFNDPGDNDTFLIRRARPSLRGTLFDDVDFRLQVELANTVELLDAWVRYTYSPELRLKVGKMKTGVGLERLQSPANLLLVERGLASNLTPTRDIGAELQGKFGSGWLDYQVGIFNGAGNNQRPNNDLNDPKTVSGRVLFTPFAGEKDSWLSGLSAGFGGSYGNEGNSATPTQKSPGQETFFSYNATTIADGTHYRLNPQVAYFWDRYGLIAEAVYDNQAFARGGVSRNVGTWGWTVAPSVVISGGTSSFNGVTLDKGASVFEGGWGAWQVAGRYSGLMIDDEAFAGTAATQLANPATSVRTALDWGLSLNWYPSDNLKVMLDYDQTRFSDGYDRPTEHVLFTRCQVAF